MNKLINDRMKILLISSCLVLAVVGFMYKLPSSFRSIDKELHAVFYFIAAAFLNILFSVRNIFKHVLIFGLLYLFGMSIEYAQEYSNQFVRARIHGRYDPADVKANLKGLIAFSAVWVVYTGYNYLFIPKRNTVPVNVECRSCLPLQPESGKEGNILSYYIIRSRYKSS